MPATRTTTSRAFPIPSSAVILALFVLLAAVTSIAFAATPNARLDGPARISVTAVAGDVAVTMAGAATDVQPESTVSLPARVVTGSDGMLGLAQAGTNLTVAGDTDIEIPAEAVDGNLVARLVQHRGNVFYDVAHRDVGKLRVETPYLVAVIKGTQFNVAVQDDSTTISLFEGSLEIRTPDGSDVIQLNAGEIAIRSLVDDVIRVVGMNEERVQVPRPGGRADGGAVAAARPDQTPDDAARPDAAAVRVVGVSTGSSPAENVDTGSTVAAASALLAPRTVDLTKDVAAGERSTVQIASSLGLGAGTRGGLDVAATAALDLGLANAGLGVSAGAGRVDAGLSANVDLGVTNVSVAVDTGLNLGAGRVDLGLTGGANVGGAITDIGLGAKLDLGTGGGGGALSVDTGLNLGGVSTGVGLGTSVDLGNVGLDTGVDLGGRIGVDLGVDAGLAVADGTVDLGLDTGIDLGSAVVDVGLGTGVGLSGGTADAGLHLGNIGVDVGLAPGTGLGLGIDLGGPVDVIVVPPVVPVLPIHGGGHGSGGSGSGDGGGLLGGLPGRKH